MSRIAEFSVNACPGHAAQSAAYLMAAIDEQTDKIMIPNLLAAYISVHAVTG